ncbi:MAG: NAD-dependent epimerase/dehydratase family protein, partial [Vicinamibacterales bacterium]
MRIFLTGGTGYVGGAVLEALVRGGHDVEALVRNRERAAWVQARGAHPVLGDLTDPATYADAAAAADGAIHAAFEYSARGPATDAAAIDALLRGGTRQRFVIYTSGVWVLGNQHSPADESTPPSPAPLVSWRPALEERVLNAATSGLRTAVIRPGLVYGGSRGFVSDLFKNAADGLVRIIGTGDNRWPLVYDRDLGELYLRVAANADASGVYHANDEGDERVNDLVTAIIDHATVQPGVRRIPLAEARQKMGPVADALVLDQVVRSPRARALGWHPS